MKKCNKCNIEVSTDKHYCPLCFGELLGSNDKNEIELFSKEKRSDKIEKTNSFLFRLFVFLTISIIAIVVSINLYADAAILWSLIVVVALVYVWVLIAHTVLSRRGLFEKVLFQFLTLMLIAFTVNKVTPANDAWFWSYFVSCVSLVVTTVLFFILTVNHKKEELFLGVFNMLILLVSLSVIILALKLDEFKILNVISLIYTSLFAVGILLFGYKQLLRAVQKVFHV